MRKLFLVLMVAAGTFTFQSCKDDEKKVSNELKYDDGTMKIGAALKDTDVDYETGDEGTIFYHQIFFVSEGLTYTENNILGEGDVLRLYAVTDSETEITPGTYTLGEGIAPFMFYADLYIDFNSESGPGANHEVESGTVTVKKSGSKYTFTFDLMFNGKKLTGSFSGTLQDITIPK